MECPGKRKRITRIMKDGRTVIIPMDHGVTIGPVEGLVNMQKTISKLIRGGADAVVIHKGIAKNVDSRDIGLIVHLSGSTKYAPDPNRKIKVCDVAEAVKIGADAVSVHINVGSKTESEMLSDLSTVSKECEDYGIPLLAMMYPRGEKIPSEHDEEAVSHAARLGAELGADIVKTNYTGSIESFKKAVSGCPVPVIIAGGPKMETSTDVLQMVHDSLLAGGSGISIGRNVFQHKNPEKMTEALKALIHDRVSVEVAKKILGD